MKYIFAILFAALLVLPGFAQASVDNCCQVGRACESDADWLQGWSDHQAGQCDAPEMPAMSPAGATSYAFSGQGKHTTGAFMLTPGKWRITFESTTPAYIGSWINQLDDLGNRAWSAVDKRVGPCLKSLYAQRNGWGSTYAHYVSMYSWEMIVTKPCTVEFYAYELSDDSRVRDHAWEFALYRININY